MRVPWLAAAGIGSAAVFTAGWIAAGLVSDTADWSRGSLADLGARGADAAYVWNAARAAAGALLVPFAFGFYRLLPAAKVSAALLAAMGVALVLQGTVFRRDCLSTDPACGPDYSWHHYGHEVVGPFGSIGLVLALVLAARVFRDDRRLLLLWRATVAAIAALVVLLAVYVTLRDEAGSGVVLRLAALVTDAWIALVAGRLATHGAGGVPQPAAAGPRARVRRRRRSAGSARAPRPS